MIDLQLLHMGMDILDVSLRCLPRELVCHGFLSSTAQHLCVVLTWACGVCVVGLDEVGIASLVRHIE